MILKDTNLWREELKKSRNNKHKWKILRFAEMVANQVEASIMDDDLLFEEALPPAAEHWKVDLGMMPGMIKDAFDLLEQVWDWGDQLQEWREEYEVPDPPPPPPLPDIMDDPFSGKPIYEGDVYYGGEGYWLFPCAKDITVRVGAPNKRAAIAKFNVRPADE